MDDFEKSSEYEYKMLELDKRDMDALTLLISTFFHTYQFDKVIEYSEWALDISDERDADICSSLAFSYLMMGERQKGWDILVDAIFRHPEDSAYYYTILASYLYATNEDEKAMQTYEIAIKKDPSRPEPYLNLAMHYKSKGELENARKYYGMYVEREKFYVMGFDEF